MRAFRAYFLLGLGWALLAAGLSALDVRPDVSGSAAVLADGSVTGTKVATDTLTVDNMADDDWGIASISNNVMSMDSWRATGGLLMCVPGSEAATVCQTYTNLAATFTSIGTDGVRQRDLSTLHQYRLSAVMSAVAVAGDLAVQCDLDPAFGTVDGIMDSSGAQICTSTGPCVMASWVAIPAACAVDDIWLRFGMVNGDTAEDPALRSGEIQFR